MHTSGNGARTTSPNLLSHKSNKNASKNVKIDFSRALEITQMFAKIHKSFIKESTDKYD